jgi:hypothetical protein
MDYAVGFVIAQEKVSRGLPEFAGKRISAPHYSYSQQAGDSIPFFPDASVQELK